MVLRNSLDPDPDSGVLWIRISISLLSITYFNSVLCYSNTVVHTGTANILAFSINKKDIGIEDVRVKKDLRHKSGKFYSIHMYTVNPVAFIVHRCKNKCFGYKCGLSPPKTTIKIIFVCVVLQAHIN